MSEYHKIQSIFKRDMSSPHKTLVEVYKDGDIAFGGRTDEAQIPAPLASRLKERFLPLAAKLGEVFPDMGWP